MFKTLKHIKKKILAAAMATAILVSGNIGINSGNHSITDTTATVSAAKTIYYCPYCDENYNTDYYWFFTEYSYNRHLLKEHNRSLYMCLYCNYKLESQTALDAHMQTCEWKNKSYIKACPYNYDGKGCKKDTWGCPDDYEKHLDDCTYKSKCPFCGEKYYTGDVNSKLRSHITYDCKKNENRQISEQNKLALDGKLPLPKWNVDKKEWECQWEDCDYHTPTETVCVDHIMSHRRDKAIDKKYGKYF